MGTFDISILDIGDGVVEVRSTDGDVSLGGDNLDEALLNFIADEFKKDKGIDLRNDNMALARLKEAAEKAKIELSSSNQTDINLPYITVVDNIPQHLVRTITRSEFERIIDPIIKKSIAPCERALKNSGLSKDDIQEVLLVGGSTRVPAIQEIVKRVFGKDGNKSVNPDEVVSDGASIQGGVLSGDKSDILLLDVVSISYGIETMGEVFTKMIEANTTIPTTKKQTFSTAQDNQNAVTLNVAQGERPMFRDNKSLGTFNLDGIMPAPRGIPQIEVSMDIDSNCILHVSAKDLATGKQNSIKIQNSTNLSKEDIERMKKDAEMNAEADAKRKEEVDQLNEADTLIFSTEKQIKEFGEKIQEDEKKELEEVLGKLKVAHGSKNLSDLKTLKDELNGKWNVISTRLYSQQAQEANQQAPEQPKQDDNVQDVNFEEVK